MLYKTSKFKQISSQKIDNLKYAYSVLILEYFKTQLSKNSNNENQQNSKGTVIDVTDAS